MYKEEELERMRCVDIREVDIESLTDIRDIRIDESKSVSERMEQYLAQVSNPYLLRMGEYVIKLQYSTGNETLDDRVKQYMERMDGGVWNE